MKRPRNWLREPPRDRAAVIGSFLVIIAMLAVLWYFGKPTPLP